MPADLTTFERITMRLNIINSEIELHKKQQIQTPDYDHDRLRFLEERIGQLRLEQDQLYHTATEHILGGASPSDKLSVYRTRMAEFWIPGLKIWRMRRLDTICEALDIACDMAEQEEFTVASADWFSILDLIEFYNNRHPKASFDCDDDIDICIKDCVDVGILVACNQDERFFRFASPEVRDLVRKMMEILMKFGPCERDSPEPPRLKEIEEVIEELEQEELEEIKQI